MFGFHILVLMLFAQLIYSLSVLALLFQSHEIKVHVSLCMLNTA